MRRLLVDKKKITVTTNDKIARIMAVLIKPNFNIPKTKTTTVMAGSIKNKLKDFKIRITPDLSLILPLFVDRKKIKVPTNINAVRKAIIFNGPKFNNMAVITKPPYFFQFNEQIE